MFLTGLGLAEHYVSAEVGTSLYELGRDPDSRAVSLTILVRLSRLLEVPLDDLVTTDDPHVHPPGEPEPPVGEVGDDYVLLGLIATYNKLGVLRVLNLLGWTRSRLDTALTAIAEHLAPTALRVVATDERLTLMLRPDVIPAVIRAQFEHEYRADYPLDPGTAVAVLELVREKILEPFPEREEERPYTRPKSFNAAYLVSARLAVPVAATTDGTDTTEVEIHPDVLFALGLADAPAATGT